MTIKKDSIIGEFIEPVNNRLPTEKWDGPTYQDILDIDNRFNTVSSVVREHKMVDLGDEPVSATRYTDPEFFKKEVEYVFLKTWQYAVREEEIPNPGDYYVYDLVGKSVLVTRQEDGSVKAFENICLHRGRQLTSHSGCKKAFTCPYHGFTWGIDGKFKPGPAAWDFSKIDKNNFPLSEVRVARWGGFVFVNFDPNCPPLEEVLGPMIPHFDYWKIDNVYKAAHVGKILPANWKVCQEAFIEHFHVGVTHAQVSPYTPDANAQVDILSDHVTRSISWHGYPGVMYRGPKLSPKEIFELAMKNGNKAGAGAGIEFSDNITERHCLAATGRKNLEELTGWDLSDRCDADFIDGFSYGLFPNFQLWGHLARKISYRFRPVGLNHEQTLMEVFLFKLAPKDGPAPEPSKLQMIDSDKKWEEARGELAYLSGVFDQDDSNIPEMQIGLRQMGDRGVYFGEYSEARCRHLHRMIDVYIERGEAEKQHNKK